MLSLTRLNQMEPVDHEAAQVTAGAGVTLQRVAGTDPDELNRSLRRSINGGRGYRPPIELTARRLAL